MISRWRAWRLRRAARILADHIHASREHQPFVGCDVARDDVDTIVVAIREDIRIELSDALKAATGRFL